MGIGKIYALRTTSSMEILQSSVDYPSLQIIIIQMDTQELQRYDLVQSFLQSIRNAQSKQQFLTRVHEFDSRFTEEHNGPSYSQKQKSVEKLPPMPQQKPKNPFKSNLQDFRHQSLIQPSQNQPQPSPFTQQPSARGSYSRSQQNFYKQPTSSALKTEQHQMPGHYQMQGQYQMPGQYGTNPTQGNPPNYGGGMGILNYNAYNQRQYEQLKQQFFRPPNVPRPPEQYNRMSEDSAFNFAQMNMGLGMSSSSDILPDNSFGRQSGRGYPERSNPFMKP